jgi:hypothetical protein
MNTNERKILQRLSRGAASPGELAQATGIAPRTLALDVLGLEQVGWVTVDVGVRRITPAGREALADIQPWWAWFVCRGCGGLRFGPRHLAYRLAGWCDGNGSLV